jgi:hypothetical protein
MKPPETKEEYEAHIADLNAKLATAEASILNRDQQLSARVIDDDARREELTKANALLQKARTALAPFATKTADWEQWPPEGAPIARKLTWGDIKVAADTALAIGA